MGLFSSPLQWPLSDEACTSGQLVVASRESQYKVFHFHHGGLDKLPDVLQQWKYCTETHLKDQVAREGGMGAAPPFPSLPLPSPPLPSCLPSNPDQNTHSLPWSPRPQGCDLWSLGANRAATLGLKHVPRLLVKAVLRT